MRNLTEEVLSECDDVIARNGTCNPNDCKVSSVCRDVLEKLGADIRVSDPAKTDAVLRDLPCRTDAEPGEDE